MDLPYTSKHNAHLQSMDIYIDISNANLINTQYVKLKLSPPFPPLPTFMSTLSKIQLDKRRFVHRMGPYYRQASAEGDASLERFLQSIFRHYCDRWPLDRRDYPDLDVMKAYLEVERTVSYCNISAHSVYITTDYYFVLSS